MESGEMNQIKLPMRLVFCHGIPDRCFKINGKPMRICSRCFGVFFGQSIAILILLFAVSIPWYWLILFILPMVVDWSIQEYLSISSNNARRYLTGLFGGIGVGYIQFKIMFIILQSIWNIVPK